MNQPQRPRNEITTKSTESTKKADGSFLSSPAHFSITTGGYERYQDLPSPADADIPGLFLSVLFMLFVVK
jgi:hypothetical protein